MTLYLIGIGLSTEKDITVKGLEIVKNCNKIYLESYTSLLQCSIEDLEKFYGKKIINEAKEQNIAFLIIGDVFSATTHMQLFKLAKEKNVNVEVINNASVINSVGITGLELYKFGKITSIPFIEDHPNLETPYNVYKENLSLGLHTLFLLDLKPEEDKFMTVNEALNVLETIEDRKKEDLINDNLLVIGCARLGSNNYLVKSGKLSEVKEFNFGKPLHCLIIPGKMHFIEEEMFQLWKIEVKKS